MVVICKHVSNFCFQQLNSLMMLLSFFCLLLLEGGLLLLQMIRKSGKLVNLILKLQIYVLVLLETLLVLQGQVGSFFLKLLRLRLDLLLLRDCLLLRFCMLFTEHFKLGLLFVILLQHCSHILFHLYKMQLLLSILLFQRAEVVICLCRLVLRHSLSCLYTTPELELFLQRLLQLVVFSYQMLQLLVQLLLLHFMSIL